MKGIGVREIRNQPNQISGIRDHFLRIMTPLELRKLVTLLKSLEDFAQKNVATFEIGNDSIFLIKEINGKQWPILTINIKEECIDVVVDVKQFLKDSVKTGLNVDDVQIIGYTIRQVHEVRGPLAWLLDTDIKGREIVTSQGKKFVKMRLEELKLKNGDIVRYNTWDFSPYALYKAKLSEETILCESPEHKRAFILQLADDYCAGKTELENELSPEIKAQLHEIHETRKAPAYLNGYEIHHDGYGNMCLLSKEIHCRKLSHIGGSYLMNTRNYAVYIDNRTLDESVRKILSTELTADAIIAYDNFTIEGKERFISSIGNRILCELRLGDVQIEFADLPQSTTCGFYLNSEKRIVINRRLLENLRYALRTEMHEIRHAVQYDAVRHPERYGFSVEMLNKWADNIKYYIKPEWDYEAYVLQPIELDAELWASKTMSNQQYHLYV